MNVIESEYSSLLNKDSHGSIEEDNMGDLPPPPPLSLEYEYDMNDRWGATPRIRSQWLKPSGSFSNITRALSIRDMEQSYTNAPKSPAFEPIGDRFESPPTQKEQFLGFQYQEWGLWSATERTPGLLIALILNLFLSTSFGLATFPPEWTFPAEVPRAIGVQMFLFSTLVCQIVLTRLSQFPGAVGMMMVENIPFLQVISRAAVQAQGPGIETFSTVFVTFALASIIVGVFFYCLGKFNLGNAVYFFPKHIIVGCIGGIGIFIFQTGMEVASNVPWKWSIENLELYCTDKVVSLWLLAVFFEIVLRILQKTFKHLAFLPPFYFISIPPVFYGCLYLMGIPVATAHEHGWFFERGPAVQNPFLIWQLMDLRTVQWSVVGQSIPTIIALTIFSLMHVPINIPSLSLSTQHMVDMNNELKAHGWSNLVSGFCGGLQNYLCYSNSLLYFKCNGRGRVSGYLLALLTCIFFYFGPTIVYYIPRCMAGCLLIHVGVDLTKEGIWDSRKGLDNFEYASVIIIALVMTSYGLTAGLALGVVCAAVAFTLQITNHVDPVRGITPATTLRSSQKRSKAATALLDKFSKHILVVQLQGQLFFLNATSFASVIEKRLVEAQRGGSHDIWCLILDFTLVLAIDSSAAETVAGLYDICRKYGVRLCYSRTSKQGFPCAVELSERLESLSMKQDFQKSPRDGTALDSRRDSNTSLSNDNGRHLDRADSTTSSIGSFNYQSIDVSAPLVTSFGYIHIADSLDDALAWCEDAVIAHVTGTSLSGEFDMPDFKDKPRYLRQIYSIVPSDVSYESVDKLFSYFKKRSVPTGTVLWRLGDASHHAVVLATGRLINSLEDEPCTMETINVGHLVGEYGLLTGHRRYGTLTAVEPSVILELDLARYQEMERRDPQLALVLSKICMAYLHHRVMHVSNRIWECHCLPV